MSLRNISDQNGKVKRRYFQLFEALLQCHMPKIARKYKEYIERMEKSSSLGGVEGKLEQKPFTKGTTTTRTHR